MSIHPTAIISEQADIDATAEIGPFCVIEGCVQIGPRSLVESHVRIGSRYGRVSIGADNLIQCGAVLGGPAQDYSYADAETSLEIGDHNRIGEHTSISLGTSKGGGCTRLGDHNFIMAYVHLGHDCLLEDHVVITNGTQLAGHVTVEHHALLSGQAGATQFVRFGAYSFLVGASYANKDIPPFTIAEGHWARPKAVNRVGLRRAGFDAAARKRIERAIRVVLDLSLTMDEVVAVLRDQADDDEQLEHLVDFLSSSKRGVARG